jgi:hypothetical protein
LHCLLAHQAFPYHRRPKIAFFVLVCLQDHELRQDLRLSP